MPKKTIPPKAPRKRGDFIKVVQERKPLTSPIPLSPTFSPTFSPTSPLTVTEETRYSTVKLPRGRGVQCLQWYLLKHGRIPTVDELTQYKTQFTPQITFPAGSKEWEL